jgi:hypothetical protein
VSALVLGLIACAFAGLALFLGWPIFQRKTPSSRKAPSDNGGLLDAIIARQSPQNTPGQRQRRRPVQNPQLAALEGHLRNAILDPGARERLVNHAMRTSTGDRATAIRKVLADLHGENNRWA